MVSGLCGVSGVSGLPRISDVCPSTVGALDKKPTKEDDQTYSPQELTDAYRRAENDDILLYSIHRCPLVREEPATLNSNKVLPYDEVNQHTMDQLDKLRRELPQRISKVWTFSPKSTDELRTAEDSLEQ